MSDDVIGWVFLGVVASAMLALAWRMLIDQEFSGRKTIIPDDSPEVFAIPPGVTDADLAKMRRYLSSAISQDVSVLYIREGRWVARTVWGEFATSDLLKRVNKSGEVLR